MPADSLLASAWTLETAKAYETILALAAANGARDAAAFEQEMDQTLGFKVKEDLLAALGKTWTFHMAVADGWLTGITFTAEVRDRAKLVAAQEKLLAAMERDEGRSEFSPHVRKVMFGEQEIHLLEFRGSFFPVQPSWCITKDKLIVTLYPQAIKSVLSRPAKKRSLAEMPELAPLLKPGNVIAFSDQDSQRMFESFYPYVQMLVPMMLGDQAFVRGTAC